MRKLLLFAAFSVLCLSCQKTEVQSNPTASSNAAEGFLVGVGFYGGLHPYGDAKITYGSTVSTSTLLVPFGAANKTVTITAVEYTGYQLDYWWQYSAQPPYSGPVPARTKVHAGEKSFNHTVSGEVWFEPVFTAPDLVSVSAGNTGGTVSKTPAAVHQGDYYTVTATPGSGYQFDYWMIDGNVKSYLNPYSAQATGNKTFVAYFKAAVPPIETVNLDVTWMVGGLPDFNNQSRLEFIDGTGTPQSIALSPISHTYEVKKGSEIRLQIQIAPMQDQRPYCCYKSPEGSVYDRTPVGAEMIVDTYVYTLDSDASIVVRAEYGDFREDFYNQYGYPN